MWDQRRLNAYSASENRIGRRVQRADVYDCKTNRQKVQRKYRARRAPPAAKIILDPGSVIRIHQHVAFAAVRRMALLVQINEMRSSISRVEIDFLPTIDVGNFAMGSRRKHQSTVVK